MKKKTRAALKRRQPFFACNHYHKTSISCTKKKKSFRYQSCFYTQQEQSIDL
jgi:hypothetical protein